MCDQNYFPSLGLMNNLGWIVFDSLYIPIEISHQKLWMTPFQDEEVENLEILPPRGDNVELWDWRYDLLRTINWHVYMWLSRRRPCYRMIANLIFSLRQGWWIFFENSLMEQILYSSSQIYLLEFIAFHDDEAMNVSKFEKFTCMDLQWIQRNLKAIRWLWSN